MVPATFWIGFVLAAMAGAAVATAFVLWRLQARKSAAAETEAVASRSAAEATRPLAETLARIEGQIRTFESQRQHLLGGVEAHLASLSKDTVALSQALRGTNSRGRWGELTLKRVAELAGMSPYCDFAEQVSGDGRRPDMIVKLPGGRRLAVDAKVPLSAYLEAGETGDAAMRAEAMERHAGQLWRHVQELASRQYWTQFEEAPEMVILFLPGEHLLSDALERRPDLLDAALVKKVLIATPVTLVSVLKGVAYGWRQEKLAQNAEELRKIAGELHDRARVFGETYVDAGRHLARAVEAYNKSAGSWDSRLLPSLRRMKELGAGVGEAPEPPKIDSSPRVPQPLDSPNPHIV